MAASHPVWMPFDQDMVKLEIPTKFLLSLGLKDTELLRVVIERRQGDGVSIRIFKGEKEITKIPGSPFYMEAECGYGSGVGEPDRKLQDP